MSAVYLAYLAVISATAFACYRLSRFYHYEDPNMISVVLAKRMQKKENVGMFKRNNPLSVLSSDKIELIKSCESSADILRLYESKKVTVEEFVLHMCYQALEADEKVNCITETMFEEALEQARALDKHFETTGKLFGPLHGVPVSLKDSVSYAGKDSTVGVIKFSFKPKNGHAVIVRQMIEAGAVPFVKTNVPQTMLTFECRNPLWGQTDHPSRKGFTPGGSSGGEGALIALKASFMGIGNDVGGSLRIPAHFSGICALKPSFNRISFQGSTGYYPASLTIHPVNGPMGRTVDDLINLSSVLMGPTQLDARVIKTPFRSEIVESKKKLRFGIALTDGFVTPVPAVTRALNEAKDALIRAGHEVVEFAYPSNIVQLVSMYYALISGDGGHHFLQTLYGEPIDPGLKTFFVGLKMNPQLHRLISRMLPSILGDQRVTSIVDSLGVKMTKEILVLEGERIKAQHAFDQLWKDANIDVLLCPPNAMPAVPYGYFTELNFTATYTILWNLLDYVAGVLPVTRVDPELDAYPSEHVKPSGNYFKSDVLESLLHRHYDQDVMEGLPVGVQVVGLPYHEEEVLHAMKSLEDALLLANKPFQHIS